MLKKGDRFFWELDTEALKRDEARAAELGGEYLVAFNRWEKAQWWKNRRAERAAAV